MLYRRDELAQLACLVRRLGGVVVITPAEMERFRNVGVLVRIDRERNCWVLKLTDPILLAECEQERLPRPRRDVIDVECEPAGLLPAPDPAWPPTVPGDDGCVA